MNLVFEVFPGYNPLPNLVKFFKAIDSASLLDSDIVCESIAGIFEEAGVLVNTAEDIGTLINLLIEFDILEFKKEPHIHLNLTDNYA